MLNQSNQDIFDWRFVGPKGVFIYIVILILPFCAALCPCLSVRAADNRTTDSEGTLVPGARSKRQRVLSFPKDYSLGEIEINAYAPAGPSQQLCGAARGTIVVPAGKMVKFKPAKNFYKNPSIINTFPADGFDSIKLAASSMDVSEDGLCDRALSYVGHLKGLVELNLDGSDATDTGAAHAAELPNLQRISAWSAMLEGKCIKQFASLKQLQTLNLPRNSIKDENLQNLCALPHLQYLSISRCGISDTGVKYLANCASMISLNLENNPKITDQSIKYLIGLKKLRYLRLADTSVTAKGVLPLKALSLVWLGLPAKNISPDQLRDIRKALPKIHVGTSSDGKKSVDSETETIFAPLH